MQQNLIDRIRSRGYWRINFRPASVEPDISLQKCLATVEANKVRLRGWDYPHVQRNTEHGRAGPAGSHYESWTDWQYHIEFWRMYRSTQFLHYLALKEDWVEAKQRESFGFPDLPFLGVVSAVYSMTEILEFASRLTRSGFYESGLSLKVSLINTHDRLLWVDTRRRAGFSEDRRTLAQCIDIGRSFKSADILSGSAESAIDMTLELFDNFGWNPPAEILSDIQTKFLVGDYE